MSEYWVSHKKYFCKYCDIYITDDAPSRRQHEAGLRHKGNRERFVKNLYKQGERRNKDLEEERREMARVEAAANAAFAQDVSSGHAFFSSQPSRPATVSKKPERPSSQWENYTTAKSLGITDPDEERMKAEIERRRTQGVVGEWEVVAPPPPPLPDGIQPPEEDTKESVHIDSLPQKREAEASLDDDEDVRRFKLRKRAIGEGLGEIWDPVNIPIKLKSEAKDRPTGSRTAGHTKSEDGHATASESQALRTTTNVKTESDILPGQAPLSTNTDKPKWQSMRWKRAAESIDGAGTATNEETDEQKKSSDVDQSVIKEDETAQLFHGPSSTSQWENDVDPKIEPSVDGALSNKTMKLEDTSALTPSDTPGGLFRKRKVPAAARGRRG